VVERASKLDEYVLGLVPVGVAVILGVLVLPRRAVPEDVPVPVADGRALERAEEGDRRLAREDLSGDARALGTTLRTFHEREAKQRTDPYMTADAMNDARLAIDATRAPLLDGKDDHALLALRATQLEGFLAELRAFERTGQESSELVSLAGPFVERMRDVGWCKDHALAMDDSVARVMFDSEWDSLVGVERPPFAASLDEQRVLYAFYLRHPHVPETVRKRIDEARAIAATPKQCHQLDLAFTAAAETWLIEKVKRLRSIDEAYPVDYALGVVHYREREYPAAVQSFRDWIDAHPDGLFTIRARDYLREATYQTGLLAD
jgi:hypothetical protein